jgi:hypothetical protein
VTCGPAQRSVGFSVSIVAVRNYFTYWWTFLSDHLSDEDATGTLQRIQVKSAPREQENSMAAFGATEPANSDHIDPVQKALFGDAVQVHGQEYGRAVTPTGEADCESGQRGYLDRLATGFPERFRIVVEPRTPGVQGTTFTGRARVPEGQTFTAEPGGIAPPVVMP